VIPYGVKARRSARSSSRGDGTIAIVRRRLSVIIPALNEERTIAEAIARARAAGAAELIVADAGSTDRTCAIARELGCVIIAGDQDRGTRLNRAAAEASGDVLLFLHADTLLPEDATARVFEALDAGFTFGGFRLRFIESFFRLRVAAWMINLRTRWTRCPWGDQAQFIERGIFHSTGGFRDFPLMEDYELAVRMRRRARSTIVPAYVRTSGRRFLQKGILRTSTLNWIVIVLYRLGVTPERLARFYR
jgi:rSAM/selenodomain-associated transferase 2